VGFDLELLQIEVEALLRHLALSFGREISVSKATYSDLFIDFLGLHPLDASLEEMARLAEARGLPDAKTLCGEERIHWLDFLFSCLIQPQLTPDCLVMVSRYPAILPSLARASLDDPRWVERVELFWGGMELGNGFHELTDPSEQEFRFKQDLAIRNHLGLDLPSMDERLLDALRYGMDNCAGIAIGLDRLLMVLMGVESIGEVLAFPFERA
jgi:lysyl-tRNA synthetase class 2